MFYFELSSTGNHIMLQLGAEGPFDSTQHRLQTGKYLSQEFSIDVSGEVFSVSPVALVDENGNPVDTAASLLIDCDA